MKRNQNLALEVDAATPRVEALKEQVTKLSDKPETTDEQSEQIEKLETNLEEKWTSLKVCYNRNTQIGISSSDWL